MCPGFLGERQPYQTERLGLLGQVFVILTLEFSHHYHPPFSTQPQPPLLAKPTIYFDSMLIECLEKKLDMVFFALKIKRDLVKFIKKFKNGKLIFQLKCLTLFIYKL